MARADALSYLAERIRKLAAGDDPNGRTEHHQIARELDRLASTTSDYVATLERDLKIAEDEWKRQLINCQTLKSALLDLNSNAHSPTFVIRRIDEALDQISSTELTSEPQKLLLSSDEEQLRRQDWLSEWKRDNRDSIIMSGLHCMPSLVKDAMEAEAKYWRATTERWHALVAEIETERNEYLGELASLRDRVHRAVLGIESEPSRTGEPAESVQIGRLQIADRMRDILNHREPEGDTDGT